MSEDSGLGEIISGIVSVGIGVGIGLYVLGSIKQRMIEEEKARRQEERDNTIYTCDSCGEDYRFGDSESIRFCSDLCEVRGPLLTCEWFECHKKYFGNMGYGNTGFCSEECYDHDYYND